MRPRGRAVDGPEGHAELSLVRAGGIFDGPEGHAVLPLNPTHLVSLLVIVKTCRLIYGDYLYKHGCNTALVVTKGDTR